MIEWLLTSRNNDVLTPRRLRMLALCTQLGRVGYSGRILDISDLRRVLKVRDRAHLGSRQHLRVLYFAYVGEHACFGSPPPSTILNNV
jgi:hypothetical protein